MSSIAKRIAKVCPAALLAVIVTGVCGVSVAPAGAVHSVLASGAVSPLPDQPKAK